MSGVGYCKYCIVCRFSANVVRTRSVFCRSTFTTARSVFPLPQWSWRRGETYPILNL